MKKKNALLYAAALVSLLALGGERWILRDARGETGAAVSRAAAIMADALATLRTCREIAGIPMDEETDPNLTGIVGVESSPVTTTLGNLEAKRTTANPAWAAVLTRLLDECGVGAGDPVAIGASSSFPGLIMATLSATEALGARPLVIASLGASQWGANRPGFGWIEMSSCLREAGLFTETAVAVSLGGEGDAGLDLSREGREILSEKMARTGIPLITESDLARNVEARMTAYDRAAGGSAIKAFVNIGGSWANMGTDASVLALAPGLSADRLAYHPGRNGVIQAMSARGVPVVHLLNIRGLCRRYGLPWDPAPIPRFDAFSFKKAVRPGGAAFFVLLGVYLALLVLAGLRLRRLSRF
ncbi:MAG: poly-gamma-glutamate system protein [Candidatus Aminicenantes bacterium]|nr:poly-gamma-glutamate system protein [Candidatus Aminicenantes bacterium]